MPVKSGRAPAKAQETRRGRGRPAHQPTAKTRRQVEQMIAMGESKVTMALAIGISVPTLDLRYPNELATGAARRRLEAIDLIWGSARKGNVAAQKAVELGTRLGSAQGQVDPPAPPAPRAEKRGKKQQAADAAESAGMASDWGNDLQPPASTRVN